VIRARTPRWPLHPPPTPGEALSSWLERIADVYGYSTMDLLRYNLGSASLELGRRPVRDLDLAPPAGVLEALHERTGVPREQLHQMTVARWVPWLLDSVEAVPDGSAFDTYVRTDSVLFVPAKVRHDRSVTGWRAWLPAMAIQRACPACLTGPTPPGLPLVGQLPLTLSCPQHGCRLEHLQGRVGARLFWQEKNVQVTDVPAPVAAMDRLTHEGMTTGTVTLPGRSVHVGVWFRLLRTLIEELNTPISYVRPSAQKTQMQWIWQAIDLPVRAGLVGVRTVYEDLDWPQQQTLLHAAAAAIHLAQTGQITARGTLGSALQVEPPRPVYDGDELDLGTRWRRLLQEMVDLARADEPSARQLFNICAFPQRLRSDFERSRRTMIELGVPKHFLPSEEEIDHAFELAVERSRLYG
jgi:hypothetical protein